MDALTLFWLLGETLSLLGLAAGAVLAFLADEPPQKQRASRLKWRTLVKYLD